MADGADARAVSGAAPARHRDARLAARSTRKSARARSGAPAAGSELFDSSTKFESGTGLAELRRAARWRRRHDRRPQPLHDAHRGALPPLRRPPRPRVRRRSDADRPALLHERRRDEVRPEIAEMSDRSVAWHRSDSVSIKTTMPTADEAIRGREAKMPVADRHAVNRHAARRAVSRGPRAGDLRARLFLGRRAEVLAAAGRVHDGRRLRRRLHEESDVRGSLLAAAPATPRSCSSCSIPRQVTYDGSAEDVLGEPRSDAGHAAGQRRRHAVPVGDLRHVRRTARAPPKRRAIAYEAELAAHGFRPITTEIRDAPPFYYAEDYHQQYLAKNPERLLRHRRHRREVPVAEASG